MCSSEFFLITQKKKMLKKFFFPPNILNEIPENQKASLSDVLKGNQKSAAEIATEINKKILQLFGEYISEDGKSVSYSGIQKSSEFIDYVEQTKALNFAEITELNETERKVFFLNLYNALVIHGYIASGVPSSSLNKLSFFKTTCYKLSVKGKAIPFSLDDIEHGILRGNRKHPVGLLGTQFSSSDPQMELVMKTVDPRIHFALVCGAKSCPPIRVYTLSNLEVGLNAAAKGFCNDESNFKFDSKTNKVNSFIAFLL